MFESLNNFGERFNKEGQISQEERKLRYQVAYGISKEFGGILSGEDDKTLEELRSGKLEILKAETPDKLFQMYGLDLPALMDILENKTTFSDVEGIIAIRSYPSKPPEPIIILKEETVGNLRRSNPKGSADKICHEMIHYLGFNLIEILGTEDKGVNVEEIRGKIKTILPSQKGETFAKAFEECVQLFGEVLIQIFSDSKIEAVVIYRLGPMIDLGFIFSMKNAPEIKTFFKLLGDPDNSFWEGVVDYYSKKIIDGLSLEGEYVAGYRQRFLVEILIHILSHIISERKNISYEDAKEKIEIIFKKALLNGDEKDLEEVLNSIAIQELYERMMRFFDNLKKDKPQFSGISDRAISSLSLTDKANLTFQWIKDFFYNFSQT